MHTKIGIGALCSVVFVLAGCGHSASPQLGAALTAPTPTPAAPSLQRAHIKYGACDSGADPFGGGNGSSGSPYLICSASHLKAIQAATNTAASYQLVIDLDLTSVQMLPVSSFSGTFDGNHKTLAHYSGIGPLFWTSSGTIVNLTMTGVNVSGGSRSGSIVGRNLGAGTISGCVVDGTVSASYVIGGLVGQNDGTISGCSSSINVNGNAYDHAGGLVGMNLGAITNSTATGAVTVAGDYAGGLVGQNVGGSITHCSATGTVSGQKSSGGLVGQNASGAISVSWASGQVTGTDSVGGLVGSHATNGAGSVLNSYATGAVIGATNVGGLVGKSAGSVTNAYSFGTVNSSDPSAGGLIGSSTGTTSNSFWDTQASGKAASAGGTGETTAAMETQATYTGWDFTSVWNISAGQYPSLH